MEANDYPVETVLDEARRFMVPLYQRKYQWGDARLEPFWDDVCAKAAEVLEGDSRFEHYMGALILAPVEDGSMIARTPRVQVVDGQQRLTTFQIFLAALREVARDHGFEDLMAQINGYLFNKPKKKDTDKRTRFKLTPTPSDRDIFEDLMDLSYEDVLVKHHKLLRGGRVPKNTSFPAFRAYHLFCGWVEDFAFNGPEEDAEIDLEGDTKSGTEMEEDLEVLEERLEALLSAVLDRLKLVVITLSESDDAQVIFETLNSKGEPLLAMDLVRNNIFHRAEKQDADVEDLYETLWDPFDDMWWRAPAPNARPRRPRLDHFLAHVLTAETGKKIAVRELYAEYREFAVPKGKPRYPDVSEELKLLEKYAPLYETLEGRGNEDEVLSWLGRKLSDWQVTTVYPVAMQIGASSLARSDKEKLAQLIYSYLARRALCSLTTKNLNRVFQSLADEFRTKGPSVEVLKLFFAARDGNSTKFPNDEELRRGILESNAYSLAPRSRLIDVLWSLEMASRSKMSEDATLPGGLWIEHVLPQSWTDDWPFPDGSLIAAGSDTPAAAERRRNIHTLGNLTLLTGSLNISSGNDGFETKKAKFKEHTGLFLNKYFLEESRWTDVEIQERGEHLFALATKIWVGLEASP